eukprot:3348437-Heterocapsa_arctica.AAC.1
MAPLHLPTFAPRAFFHDALTPSAHHHHSRPAAFPQLRGENPCRRVSFSFLMLRLAPPPKSRLVCSLSG